MDTSWKAAAKSLFKELRLQSIANIMKQFPVVTYNSIVVLTRTLCSIADKSARRTLFL